MHRNTKKYRKIQNYKTQKYKKVQKIQNYKNTEIQHNTEIQNYKTLKYKKIQINKLQNIDAINRHVFCGDSESDGPEAQNL